MHFNSTRLKSCEIEHGTEYEEQLYRRESVIVLIADLICINRGDPLYL